MDNGGTRPSGALKRPTAVGAAAQDKCRNDNEGWEFDDQVRDGATEPSLVERDLFARTSGPPGPVRRESHGTSERHLGPSAMNRCQEDRHGGDGRGEQMDQAGTFPRFHEAVALAFPRIVPT
ncbi:MAG: hypothetical protein OXH76_02340 [Boseongicola sp.]|nr:hypothetical protein [Boseongicola sp.]